VSSPSAPFSQSSPVVGWFQQSCCPMSKAHISEIISLKTGNALYLSQLYYFSYWWHEVDIKCIERAPLQISNVTSWRVFYATRYYVDFTVIEFTVRSLLWPYLQLCKTLQWLPRVLQQWSHRAFSTFRHIRYNNNNNNNSICIAP